MHMQFIVYPYPSSYDLYFNVDENNSVFYSDEDGVLRYRLSDRTILLDYGQRTNTEDEEIEAA